MKRWYIWLLCALMGCAQPQIEPDQIREFYIVNKDQLIVSVKSQSDILIELEPGIETYYFLLNHKQEYLQYFEENGLHVVIYKHQYYYINEY